MVSKGSSKVTPLERLYQLISQPSPPKPAKPVSTAPAPISLRLSDVQDIVKNKRTASPEELEYILQHPSRFGLGPRQQNDIRVRLTVALAHRGRPSMNPNAGLFAVLDMAETPVGLLHHRHWFEHELRTGAAAIATCVRHSPPRCQCWRSFRERLWLVQDRYGPKSPEGWAATKLWEQFEEYELASRPERPGAALQPIPGNVEQSVNVY